MMQRIGMAIGAGLAAALLFAVMAKGTFLAVTLAYLAPLPIVIVTLGWGLDMGGLAVVVAGAVAAALLDPLSGGLFAVAIALPAWLLSAAALLPRDRLFASASASGGKTWFPVGGVVALAALFGALIGAGTVASLIWTYGGYQKGLEGFAAELVQSLKETLDGVVTLPGGVTIEDFAALFARLSAGVLAASISLMFCANLYLGARAVQLSHRLKRPWPNLPEALVLPPALGVALVACAAIVLVASGFARHLGWIGLSALCCAYALQGLAVIHALSRGLAARLPLLIMVYLVVWAVAPLSLPTLVIIGLVESLLSLRARRAAAANVKPGT
jgi:hypothetical protein